MKSNKSKSSWVSAQMVSLEKVLSSQLKNSKNQRSVADGIVGPSTWDCMGLATTDDSEKSYETENGLIVNRHFLPIGEYKSGITKKEYIFLHHTAG